jgi:hypothetical protein
MATVMLYGVFYDSTTSTRNNEDFGIWSEFESRVWRDQIQKPPPITTEKAKSRHQPCCLIDAYGLDQRYLAALFAGLFQTSNANMRTQDSCGQRGGAPTQLRNLSLNRL